MDIEPRLARELDVVSPVRELLRRAAGDGRVDVSPVRRFSLQKARIPAYERDGESTVVITIHQERA